MNRNLQKEHKKRLIMIVDDVPKNLQVLGSILNENDYDVAMADNGRDAIKIIEELLPDLILLDIMMPEMDGFEACRIIKEKPAISEIPVIFLTAKNEEDSIINGFKAGAVDYISKPFNSSELLVRVNNHIELKSSKEKLINYSKKLENLIEQKNEFLGIAAHDMKNPINAILGSAGILLSDISASQIDDNDTKKKIIYNLNSIRDTSRFMLRTVTELLNTETLDSGSIHLQIHSCDAGKIVQSVINHNRLAAEAKRLKIHTSNLTGSIVNLDEDRFWEITDNLVSNAIKYSPYNKNIYISIYKAINSNLRIPGKSDDYFVRDNDSLFSMILSVRDEGPGLTNDDRKRIFGRFQKLSATPTGGEGSSGLGLSIVKKLVEMHEGNVWVESEQGNGSNFLVRMNLAENQDKGLLLFDELEFNPYFEYISDKGKELSNKSIESMLEELLNNEENFSLELINILENELLMRWEKISKSNIINDIHKFAIDIRDIGRKFNSKILQLYGEKLKDVSMAFDIEKIPGTFDIFPRIISSMKNKIKL
jgi:two-component system, sensor histidine kinase and response regulator